MGKCAVILQFLCLHFFFQCKPPLCRWKIIVNQIWQLGTNEHRRDSCISPNVQMWQLIVTRLISVVHQTVTGTIWHTKCANWWQTVVTFWFNWSISLKNTCIKKLVLKILFCKATFHCCYQYIEGKVWKWCIIGDDIYHHAMPYTYISKTQWAKFISEGAFFFIFQDNSWSPDILPSQGYWSPRCWECHDIHACWQIS